MKEGLHYPTFDVLAERDAWDPHTREVVLERISPAGWQVLTEAEIRTLGSICQTLLGDDREPIITYVVRHFDEMLAARRGESQRAQGVPEAAVLIRDGMKALDRAANRLHGGPFADMNQQTRQILLQQLELGRLDLGGDIPAKPLFQKLLYTAVSAHYSHPTVWSEIGYAGPAYPRGYVRSERGLTDPWEARKP